MLDMMTIMYIMYESRIMHHVPEHRKMHMMQDTRYKIHDLHGTGNMLDMIR